MGKWVGGVGGEECVGRADGALTVTTAAMSVGVLVGVGGAANVKTGFWRS